MTIKFYKYQATGNDFIIIEEDSLSTDIVKKLCDRNFGIGADGVLLYAPSNDYDAIMTIYNSDGSTAKMCGNGYRCFISWLYKKKDIKKRDYSVQTASGIISSSTKQKENELFITVNLGKASQLKNYQNQSIPPQHIDNDGTQFTAYSVEIGNPHLVFLSENGNPISKKIAEKITKLYKSPDFIGKEVNVEVVTNFQKQEKSLSLIVNERGVGFTLGCGTGGGATLYALREAQIAKYNEQWKFSFPGGDIFYKIDPDNSILMSGTATHVFSGEINV